MNKYIKNIKPVDLIRRITQIVSFILLPGLFTSVFYGIKEIYTSVIGGDITVTTITSQFMLLAATVLSTAVIGRFFCGFFCSFGAMGDFLWFISRKTIKPQVKVSEKADAVLKYLKYGVLLFIIIGIWTLNLVSIDSMSNPWNIFGIYSSLSGWTSVRYLFTIGGALLAMIIVGSLFVERFFCRYLCPLGAIFAIISKVRLFNIKKNRDKCGSCRVCTNQCSMGIPLYQSDKVTSGECINCFACINHCPRKNAQVNPSPAVASVASVAAISSLLYVGNVTSASASDYNYSSDVTSISQTVSGKYTDGTYTGSAFGFRGDTTVSVTVENGYITDVTILSYTDDRKYFDKAVDSVIADILESQDVNVDAVSGATFSSNGIMNAVADALSNAETTIVDSSSTSDDSTAAVEDTTDAQSSTADTTTESGEATAADETLAETEEATDATATSDTASTSATESTSASTGSLAYTDGTYTGSGTGFRGETEVSVTVSGGEITDITVTSYVDDQRFFVNAEATVIQEILESQDVNVDAVSGATFSSNGIMEAVANALGVDYTNANDTASRGGHGGFGGRR